MVALGGMLKMLQAETGRRQDSENSAHDPKKVEVVLVSPWGKKLRSSKELCKGGEKDETKPPQEDDRIAETELAIINVATSVDVFQQNLIKDVSLRVVEFHIPFCASNHE